VATARATGDTGIIEVQKQVQRVYLLCCAVLSSSCCDVALPLALVGSSVYASARLDPPPFHGLFIPTLPLQGAVFNMGGPHPLSRVGLASVLADTRYYPISIEGGGSDGGGDSVPGGGSGSWPPSGPNSIASSNSRATGSSATGSGATSGSSSGPNHSKIYHQPVSIIPSKRSKVCYAHPLSGLQLPSHCSTEVKRASRAQA
jgi:hypothetical protein